MIYPIRFTLFFVITLLFSCQNTDKKESQSQTESSLRMDDFQGAWLMTQDSVNTVRIYQDEYFSVAQFSESNKKFFATFGGKWAMNASGYYENFEFNTVFPESVGDTIYLAPTIENGVLTIGADVFKRVDANEPGTLAGAWIFNGRIKDGDTTKRTPGPRKTMKILSGTRFQWIAYHTEEKSFLGTGGGTYTTDDGAYMETIDFFSRDSSRVGAVLPFEFSIIDQDWHHFGNNSKGEPMYEIWSLRKIIND